MIIGNLYKTLKDTQTMLGKRCITLLEDESNANSLQNNHLTCQIFLFY
jgi:hypothetical protein